MIESSLARSVHNARSPHSPPSITSKCHAQTQLPCEPCRPRSACSARAHRGAPLARRICTCEGLISSDRIVTTVRGEKVATCGAIAASRPTSARERREKKEGWEVGRFSQRCTPREHDAVSQRPPAGLVYATVLHSRTEARKVPMLEEERFAFFRTGIDPYKKAVGRTVERAVQFRRGEEEIEAGKALAAAQRRVKDAIAQREQAKKPSLRSV
ncbi:MAG: hypothetical protein SGPRY_007056, partial [Prymnesium sp.]